MARIYENLADTFGNTPLVKIPRLNKGIGATILVKMESFNPAGSVKDRIGVSMIEAAERDGRLLPGMTILEPTSGNTGIALAFVAAAKGYPCILVMPDTMTIERRNLLKAYGAQVVLTPGAEGMSGAIARANEILATAPEQIFHAAAVRKSGESRDSPPHDGRRNLARHRRRGRRLRFRGRNRRNDHRRRRGAQVAQTRRADRSPSNPTLRRSSPAEPQVRTRSKAPVPGFVPKILNTDIYDEVIRVTDADAIATARRLAREEGMLVGISAGANVWAALASCRAPREHGQNDRDDRLRHRRALSEQSGLRRTRSGRRRARAR